MRHRIDLRKLLILGVALLATLPNSARAGFTIDGAARYAVVANVGTHAFHLTSDSGVTGNVALLYPSTNSNPFQLSGGTITGDVDLQGTFTGSTGGTVTGTITQNVASLTSIYNTTLTNLSSSLGTESGTTIASGASSILASNGVLDANGNRVFTITANNFSSLAHTVTITGSASDFVVINVTGNNNVSFSAFTLSGGITSDHVLFNLLGSGQNVGVSGGHGGVINGVILGINENFNMDNATVDGRVFGGNANDFMIVSGLRVVQPAALTPSISTTPMPSTALVGSPIADEATVTGGTNPSGTVTFNLFNNANGTGPALFTDTVALVNGVATSGSFTPTVVGTDYWVATYNGDLLNNPVTSGLAAEPVKIFIPEPSSVVMMTLGAIGTVGAAAFRRRRRAS